MREDMQQKQEGIPSTRLKKVNFWLHSNYIERGERTDNMQRLDNFYEEMGHSEDDSKERSLNKVAP